MTGEETIRKLKLLAMTYDGADNPVSRHDALHEWMQEVNNVLIDHLSPTELEDYTKEDYDKELENSDDN